MTQPFRNTHLSYSRLSRFEPALPLKSTPEFSETT